MGRSLDASVVYGYDLSDPDTVRIREVDEYDTPTSLDWYDSGGEESFTKAVIRRLYESIPDAEPVEYDWQRDRMVRERLGVWFVHAGADEYETDILVAGEGPEAHWGSAVLDLDELRDRPAVEGWDAKLAAALAALGITPTQDRPRWLVYPSYG